MDFLYIVGHDATQAIPGTLFLLSSTEPGLKGTATAWWSPTCAGTSTAASGRAGVRRGPPARRGVRRPRRVAAATRGPRAGRHPLPVAREFAADGALGVGDERRSSPTTTPAGVVAARLVWMLRASGSGRRCSTGGLPHGRDRSKKTPVNPDARDLHSRLRGPRPVPRASLTDIDGMGRRHRGRCPPCRPLRRQPSAPHGSPSRAYPWRGECAMPRESRLRWPAAAYRRGTRGVRACRGPGRLCCRFLLRIGHHGVPQPAGPRTCRARSWPPLPRRLVRICRGPATHRREVEQAEEVLEQARVTWSQT